MALATPEARVEFVRATSLRTLQLAFFPDGKLYLIARVTIGDYDNGCTVKLEGERPASGKYRYQRPLRCSFKCRANERIPVLVDATRDCFCGEEPRRGVPCPVHFPRIDRPEADA